MTTRITLLLNFAVLAALVAYVAWVVSRALKSRSWPKVEAKVLDSRVVGHGKSTKPHIEFEYTVDGRRHTSHRRSVGMPLTASGSWAEEAVASCPKGSVVTVAVDPRDSTYAVLKPGIAGSHLLMIAVVGAMVLASFLIPLTMH